MAFHQYSFPSIDDLIQIAGRSTATGFKPTYTENLAIKEAKPVGNLPLQRFPRPVRIGMASQRHISNWPCKERWRHSHFISYFEKSHLVHHSAV